MDMQGEDVSGRNDGGSHCASHGVAGGLPCAGCPEAVASVSRGVHGSDLSRSDADGCWVVRLGHSEKLRSDDPCLACSFFRNRATLLAG